MLVCRLGSCFGPQFDGDACVYSRHYKRVEVAVFHSVAELVKAVFGTGQIAKCCERDVKLLWIASEGKSDDDVKGFAVGGKRLSLKMTIDRSGANFDGFLQGLLSRYCRRYPNFVPTDTSKHHSAGAVG